MNWEKRSERRNSRSKSMGGLNERNERRGFRGADHSSYNDADFESSRMKEEYNRFDTDYDHDPADEYKNSHAYLQNRGARNDFAQNRNSRNSSYGNSMGRGSADYQPNFNNQDYRGNTQNQPYNQYNSQGKYDGGFSDNYNMESEEQSWMGTQYPNSMRNLSDDNSGNFIQRKSHRGKGPKGYKRSDERIREDVCDALERSSEIDASDIEVDVENACVHLKGTVESRWMKRAAEDCIENINGVDDIQNELQVKKTSDYRTQGDGLSPQMKSNSNERSRRNDSSKSLS